MEWTEMDTQGGEWRALVTPLPPHRNSDGDVRREWVIELNWPGGRWVSPDGHGIITPEWAEGISALSSLASFLSAWDEALRHEGSDNRDLFPQEVEPFLEMVEEFATATMAYEDDPANG